MPMQKIKTKRSFKLNFLNKLSLVGSSEEKNFITENLSLMLSAGLSIPAALTSILTGLKNKALIKIVQGVVTDLNEGVNLHTALSKTTLLPPYALSLIKIGEESGNLNKNLQVVALQQQKENSLNSKIRSAMIYPILVLSITTIVGVGVAWFILPKLARVFSTLKLELPFITKALIYFANLLNHQGYWLIPMFLIILFLIVYFIFFNPKTRWFGQAILFTLPITRKLILNIELSRFGYVLSGLLSSGISIDESMRLLEESSQIYRYKTFYKYLRDGFVVGNSFKTSFEQYKGVEKLIPAPIQQVIISGEQSGKLSQSLLLVANRFDEKTEENIKNLPVLLEPVFLVIVWLGVLVVALAVIMPIYSLVGNLNNSPTSNTTKTR